MQSVHCVTRSPLAQTIDIRWRHCLQYVIPKDVPLSARPISAGNRVIFPEVMNMQRDLSEPQKPRGVIGWVILFWILGVPLTIILLVLLILALLG